MGSGGGTRRQPAILSLTSTLLLLLPGVIGVEHNLPDNVELVDPKDFGLDGQIDLDKLLGNVKALPIDGNAISSALGKPGLKTQVLTVGFDGSEGINFDDFELPQLKNDEHGPLAQAAFSSFKNFIKNSSSAAHFADNSRPQVVTVTEPPRVTTHRPGGGKRRMMKRRKIVRVNGTTTPPSVQVTEPPQPQPAASSSSPAGPKVIELDSSQIERLIASGKIGPPKSLTPGGPQVIELGQSDLDALLSSENGDEIKQILEGGDQVKDFDLSQLSSNSAPSQVSTTTRVTETSPPVEYQTSTLPQQEAPVTPPVTPLPQVTTTYAPEPQQAPREPVNVSAPVTYSEQDPGLPIIYQYNSSQDPQRVVVGGPPQPFQSAVPLQFYSSHANGQQQARLVKHPTFELISAPPVSFSSSVLPHPNNQIQVQLPPQIPQVLLGQPQQQQQQQQQQPQQQQQQQPQQQQQQLQQQQQQLQQQQQQQQQQQLQQQLHQEQIQQYQQQFRNTFINPEASSQFHPAGAPPSPISNEVVSTSTSNKQSDQTLNKIVAAKQQSSHTEQFKPSSSQGNYIQTLHKVNLPHNSVKLVTPSPQVVHSILNQVPASFQPSLAPNHIVNSPVLDPYRLGNQQSSLFQNQEPFRNTQLFNSAPPTRPPPPPPVRSSSSSSSSPLFRFPNSSSVFSSSSSSPRGPNRFRTSESSNPFFPASPSASGTSSFPNLVLNSFVAGDGLNYRPRSNQNFRTPGI